MKEYFRLFVFILACITTLSVGAQHLTPSESGKIEIDESQILVEEILTAEERDALSPNDVLMELRAGNERFVRSDLTARNHSVQIRESVAGQYPKAIVLSCVDSRVPVEDVFDKGIGDMFVARVAGNFINKDIVGSMEFACKVAGAKLILVMGHENCGAIHAAIDDVKLGNITSMLSNIEPAIKISNVVEGEKSSKNRLFVHEVSENNVRLAIEKIKKDSPILNEMKENGDIEIMGAVYDMDTGVVNFLE
ncbi:carbonic anhydrase [Flagellimonas sp. 389]|uniref:carbonic anhydrase family protein n=1 Tax=Flagellimonas sp. 389 TaxID=2835862 RepID=UPI001BD52963|nr:carbonic anhydrase family protein [Flagellimonas sp. 389]MBS9464184.1 carbonic anhydrase [Flagellimonas sp. 389]